MCRSGVWFVTGVLQQSRFYVDAGCAVNRQDGGKHDRAVSPSARVEAVRRQATVDTITAALTTPIPGWEAVGRRGILAGGQ
jgi:hypothetical protein